eukprot:COSAG06_NODE_49634_length_324_cov_0.684444_1_plen_32_part_10
MRPTSSISAYAQHERLESGGSVALPRKGTIVI